MHTQPTVFVVDPDQATHQSIRGMCQMMNLECEIFSSAQDFVGSGALSCAGCAILEIRIPDMNGLILQQEINRLDIPMPVVFLTSQASVALAVFVGKRSTCIVAPAVAEKIANRRRRPGYS